jgi:hypothetical protein
MTEKWGQDDGRMIMAESRKMTSTESFQAANLFRYGSAAEVKKVTWVTWVTWFTGRGDGWRLRKE